MVRLLISLLVFTASTAHALNCRKDPILCELPAQIPDLVLVCGIHETTADGETHFLLQKSSEGGASTRYNLFATTEFAARLLDSMVEKRRYCVKGRFDSESPSEGISLESIESN